MTKKIVAALLAASVLCAVPAVTTATLPGGGYGNWDGKRGGNRY